MSVRGGSISLSGTTDRRGGHPVALSVFQKEKSRRRNSSVYFDLFPSARKTDLPRKIQGVNGPFSFFWKIVYARHRRPSRSACTFAGRLCRLQRVFSGDGRLYSRHLCGARLCRVDGSEVNRVNFPNATARRRQARICPTIDASTVGSAFLWLPPFRVSYRLYGPGKGIVALRHRRAPHRDDVARWARRLKHIIPATCAMAFSRVERALNRGNVRVIGASFNAQRPARR